MRIITKSVEETHKLVKEVIKNCPKLSLGQEGQARIIGLYGDLGSGKTTFIQGAAKALGVKENVTSPTFVIMKIYSLLGAHYSHHKGTSCFVNKTKSHLIHIDAYRLESSDELLHLGWNELINNPKNIILVEWADKVEKILPKNTQKIYFSTVSGSASGGKFIDENKRQIKI